MKLFQLPRFPGPALALAVLLFLPAAAQPATSASAPLLSAENRKLYASAFELIERRQIDRGLELARRGTDPLANKIADWIELTQRDTTRQFSEINAFLEANPRWPRRFLLLRNAELSLPADWSPEQVVEWFGDRPPITGAGALSYCRALLQLGQDAILRETVGSLWVTMDFEPRDEISFHTSFRSLLTAEDERKRLSRLLWDRRTSAVRRQLKRVGAGHASLARARLTLYRNQPGVDRAIRKVPANLRGAEGLLYERAVWRRERNRLEGVVEILNQAPTTGEHQASWWRLRKWAIWRALGRSDWELAYQIGHQHGMTEGLGFAEGEWLAGWISLVFLDRPALARAHFSRLYAGVSSPISKSRGAFWSGEAYSKLGEASEARSWYALAAIYSTTFYGQLAAQRIGRETSIKLAEPPAVANQTETDFLASELVRAARVLGEIGQPRLQQTFVSSLRRDARTKTDLQLLSQLNQALGRYDLAIRTAKAARRQGVDLGSMLYPVRQLPPTSAGLEPALVLALIRQESEFYTKARSSVGALGLMQLMPATARQTARSIGMAYNRNRLTSDPEYNLRLGQAYLAQLLTRFDGSYILALAAYNAGPARAERWIREFGDPRDPAVDPVLWIERIPFSETRNYVQRILESLVVYRGANPGRKSQWTLSVSPLGS